MTILQTPFTIVINKQRFLFAFSSRLYGFVRSMQALCLLCSLYRLCSIGTWRYNAFPTPFVSTVRRLEQGKGGGDTGMGDTGIKDTRKDRK